MHQSKHICYCWMTSCGPNSWIASSTPSSLSGLPAEICFDKLISGIGLYKRFSFVMYTQCVISTRDLFWQDHRYLQQPVIISPMLEHQPIDTGQTFVHNHQNHLPENSQHLNAVAASGDWQKADTCWQCHHLLKASISTHSHQRVSQRLNTLCHLNPNHWYPNKVIMRKMMRKMMRMRM